MVDRLGQQLGNYRLTSLLGRGGFAEVYLGEHVHLKTYAAVKVLRTQLSIDEANKFRIEAQTLAHLINPYIIRVLEFGFDGDIPYLIMDYAPNGTLRQRHARNTKVPLATVISYVKQVAEALQYAHDSQKLIHRDIKPENMLLGRQKEVLLSDFGIATVAQSSQGHGTETIAGTAIYMAPEQISGKPRPASDQYALSVVVYEWLTGAPPFQGSFAEITTQHIYTSPPRLNLRVPTIPSTVEQVVLTALEKDPDRRFGSVRAFANALEQAMSTAQAAPLKQPKLDQQPIRVAYPADAPSSTNVPPTTPSAAVSTPPGSVPALPKSTVSNVWWPTFLISLDERKAISGGLLPQEQMGTPREVLMKHTPSGPLPVTTVFWPPSTVPLEKIQYLVGKQGAVQPVINTLPGKSPIGSVGGPTNLSPQQAGSGKPAITPQTQIVRSSASSPLPLTRPTRKALWFGATSLVTVCLSIILLAFTFMIPFAAAPWASLTIFALAIAGFAFGFAAIQKSKAVGRAKALAGSGVALSILVTLLEIADRIVVK